MRPPSGRSDFSKALRKVEERQSQGGGLCTQRPATIVATTCASRSSHGSRSSTTRSASRPGISVPRRRSSPASQAGATQRRVERLVDRQRLLGVPGGLLVDRAPDAGADAGERVELLDRRVGAVRDDGARVDQRAVGVGAGGLARPSSGRRGRGRTARARTAPTRRRRAPRSAGCPRARAAGRARCGGAGRAAPRARASARTRRAPRGSRGRRSRARRPGKPAAAPSRTISASSSPLVICTPLPSSIHAVCEPSVPSMNTFR